MKLKHSIFISIAVLIAAATLTHAANQVTGWGGLATPSATNPIAIAGGDGFSLALNGDGTVSQLDFMDPPPADLTNAVSIAAGDNVAIALRVDGTVRVWGTDIGNPPADLTNVVAVTAGWESCVALKADGTARSWGRGPVVPSGLSNLVAVVAGGCDHFIALHADGKVTCWGDNNYGQSDVPLGLSNVVAVTAGCLFSLALKSDGTVVAWGNNQFGQTNVPSSLTNVIAIAAENASHALALKRDGTAVAWGRNSDGQCNVPPGLTNVVAIATGSRHSMAIVGDAPPALQAHVLPAWTNGAFVMRFPTQSRRVYQPESTDSLGNPHWTALPLVAGNGGMLSMPGLTATNSHRFYRVRQW